MLKEPGVHRNILILKFQKEIDCTTQRSKEILSFHFLDLVMSKVTQVTTPTTQDSRYELILNFINFLFLSGLFV